MYRRLFLLAIIGALSACATTPVPISEAKPIEAARLLAFKSAPAEPHGILRAYRDVGLIGSACYYALSVNGVLAARLGPGETVTLYVSTGELLIRAGGDPLGGGLCGLGQDNWTQRETTFKPNEIKSFRLSIDENGKLDVQRSEENGK